MRSYRIAYLIAESVREETRRTELHRELEAEIRRFDLVLAGLKSGDPVRPLVLPRDTEIVAELSAVEAQWRDAVQPLLSLVMQGSGDARRGALGQLRSTMETFVGRIDQVVRLVEANNARTIALVRYMQFGLIALALVGTVALIYLMFLLVVRPVGNLAEGMQRMTAGEFGARLPVETRDEFGELAEGFNRMASRLQDLYATLEERVAEQTRDLAARNHELGALYDVARLLNRPALVEELSRGFLRQLMELQDAAGGAVRLLDPQTRSLLLYAHEGLTAEFASDERCIAMGHCLCGAAAKADCSRVDLLDDVDLSIARECREAGYRTVTVFPIRVYGNLLGVFNLYFTDRRQVSAEDRRLLEALGQHLGIAIQNQRLVSRDRELAVFEERSLLARELHDSIAQSLAFLNIQVQLLEDSLARDARNEMNEVLSRIREGVQESYDDVRELLTHFRSRVKQEEDIGDSLRQMLVRFGVQTGLNTEFSDAGSGVQLPAESQLQILHILQEALSNVRKHAEAKRVRLALQRDQEYVFTVEDDGRGFDASAGVDESHIGLRIMRERAQRIGAVISVSSAPGRGTKVTLRLPLGQGAGAGVAMFDERGA